MNSFELQSFQKLIDVDNAEAMVAFTLKYPVVMSEALWPEFREWLSGQPAQIQRRGEGIIVLLTSLLKNATDNWYRYPFGPGPLDEALARLLASEIDQAQAEVICGTAEVVRNLSPVYVRARMMQYVVESMEGDWRKPLLCQQLILATISARKAMFTRDQNAMECIAAIEYSAVAKMAIWETADGRYLADALGRLNRVKGHELGPWRSPGSLEFALGVLHLDPYVYNRSVSNFRVQMDAWIRKPRERMGIQFTSDVAHETALPSPLAAFTESSKHFLTSANLESGSSRGLSLKGYIEAEVWKGIAGGTTADVRAVATEALTLLGADQYTEPRASIAALLQLAGQEPGSAAHAAYDPQEEGRELLADDLERIASQKGLVETTERVNRVMQAVRINLPLALALWRKTLPLMLRRDETALASFLRAGLFFITDALGDERAKGGPLQVRTPLEAGREVQRLAQEERWPAEKLVATLLSLAAGSQATNAELEGVELVRMASSASDDLTAEWSSLLRWFTAALYSGEGSNQFTASNYSQAMKAYAISALFFLEAHLPGAATNAMELGADLVDRSNSHIDDFVTYFGVILPELERQAGSSLVARVRELGRKFFPMTVEDGGPSPSSFQLTRMLKGVLLGAAWQAGGNLEWINSSESRRMLQRIDAARQQVPRGGLLQNIGGLSMDDLLTVFAEETELAAGEGPESVLHNLEVTFDHELQRRIAERRRHRTEWSPSAKAVISALGPETVLLDYYSGNLPNGNAGLYCQILWEGSCVLVGVDLGTPGMQVLLGDAQFSADRLALEVSSARRAIQKDGDEPAVSEEARESLSASAYLDGQTGKILKDLRERGKWHLCILPFGPSHFFPFHLLPYGDGLLSDEWAVTYLPAIAMLEPIGEMTAVRTREIASFGIEFKDRSPHGLEEIPGAEDEAKTVAKVFGEQALVGKAATESAVNVAFATAQRIHISTHGLLTVSAPSFQRVYLTPDAENDGILYAWELLRQDLRGLDLLTLSACETALGRVDKGDNLRSFATNAMIAGAQTVVGTLWPVRSEVTKLFFESFYMEIKGGSGKREAFQTAQLTLRESYPRCRDWGAFWYTGRW